MKRHAVSLAQQMTDAGITPQNVASHPAHYTCQAWVYGVQTDLPFLAYAEDGNGGVILGQRACSLHASGNDWLLWNDHGTHCYRISYDGTRWVAGKKERRVTWKPQKSS